MKAALFVDSETQHLPVFERRSNDPCQPHMAEAAARLIDLDTGTLMGTMNRIVQQRGWRCHPDALAVHGITPERSMAEGIPEHEAAAELFELVKKADIIMAYSLAFDRRVVRTALQRFVDPVTPQGVEHPPMVLRVSGNEKPKPAVTVSAPGDYWNSIPSQDVVYLVSGPVKKILGTKKTPKLVEAYKALIGRDLVGAHGAQADCDAMIACYWAVLKLEGGTVPAGAFGALV